MARALSGMYLMSASHWLSENSTTIRPWKMVLGIYLTCEKV